MFDLLCDKIYKKDDMKIKNALTSRDAMFYYPMIYYLFSTDVDEGDNLWTGISQKTIIKPSKNILVFKLSEYLIFLSKNKKWKQLKMLIQYLQNNKQFNLFENISSYKNKKIYENYVLSNLSKFYIYFRLCIYWEFVKE